MNMNILRARSTLAATFGLVALVAQPVVAQTTKTSTMTTSAAVVANCTVDTTPLAFGATDVTDGKAHAGTGSLNVMCTSGTGWSAAADKGLGTTATVAEREMTSGANSLTYSLYTAADGATLWGDGTSGSAITGVGTGEVVGTPIAGIIPAGQFGLPVGTYTDSVAITLTY